MTSVTFFVPGRPFSKKRARSGQGRTYTPAETVAAEAAVRHYAKKAFAEAGVTEPFKGPVGLECIFRFAIPKRSKAVPRSYHTGHIDLDNMVKLVSDALNPHTDWQGAWSDDCQVAACSNYKLWAPLDQEEGTRVSVWTMEA